MKKIVCALSLCLCLHLTGNQIDTWSSPTTISTTGVNSTNPTIGMDSSANAVSVWLENGIVKSSNLPFGGSWGTASALSSSGATTPQLVVDAAGNATAIWNQAGAIETASQPFGGSWGSATTLAASGSSIPQLAVDTSGNVVAVWLASGVVQTATLPFGGSWSSVTSLSGSNANAPQVAIGGGVVLAVWHQLNGSTSLNNVQGVTSTIGGSWSSVATVSNTAVDSTYPQAAVCVLGNALVTWFGKVTSPLGDISVTLDSSALPIGGAWSSPVTVSNTSTRDPSLLFSKLRFANNGNAIALWTDSDTSVGEPYFDLFSAQSPNLITWGQPLLIAEDLHAYTGDIAITTGGDVFGIYMATDLSTGDVAINTVESHVGDINTDFWTQDVIISNSGTNNGYPQNAAVIVGTNTYGNAVWMNYDGSNTIIQASTGSGALIAPPSNLTVVQDVNDFGVFQEYYNVLSWDASTDPNILDYAIIRDGILLTEIYYTNLSYTDHNQVEGGSVTYDVRSIDNSGTASLPVSVSFP